MTMSKAAAVRIAADDLGIDTYSKSTAVAKLLE